MTMVENRNSYEIIINKNSKWIIIIIIISACICDVKTECSENAKIAVFMNLKSDSCKKILLKRDFPSNEDDYSVFKTNYTTNERNIEIMFFDTCGNKEEIVRLAFKVVSWANLNCLGPPYFLGFIGPEDMESLEAVLKITAPFQIPHITRFPTSLPRIHYSNTVQKFPGLQVIFKLIDELGWKSFIFEENIKNTNEKQFVQQFVAESFLKKLCILPLSELSSHIIYVGDINSNYLNSIYNSTILVLGEYNIEQKFDDIHTTNLVLFITNSRKLSKSSTNIYSWNLPYMDLNIDTDNSNFIYNAVNTYSKALNHLCHNENCHSISNTEKWSDYVSQYLSTDSNIEASEYILKVKDKNEKIKNIGRLINKRHQIEINWGTNPQTSYDSVYLENILKKMKKESKANNAICMTYNDIFDRKQLDQINQHETGTTILSEMTDLEWWTMVGTVAGVGIAMFTIGIFAVYVVYTNIRGPQQKRSHEKLDFERDPSLRRVGSDKISSTNIRSPRLTIGIQRRDSRNSIRSNLSDKSV